MSGTEHSPAGHPPAEADLRLDFLREVGDLLWPAPARFELDGRRGAAEGRVTAEFIMVPDARRPRILVPYGSPRAAAAALRGYGETGSAAARLRTRVLSLLLRSGAAGLVLRDRVRVTVPDGAGRETTAGPGTSAGPGTGAGHDSIEERLREEFGDVLVALYVRPARRANRKPVLQVLTPGGRLTGFVKVGIDPLTRSLVRAERDALHALAEAPLRVVTPPRVLHHGEWRGLDVLVLSALPVWEKRGDVPPARLAEAMVEIASVGGVRQSALAGSGYLDRLTGRVATLRADTRVPSADTAALEAALRELTERAAHERLELRFGAWHGDFSPWNMTGLAGTVLVWDWERFTTGVPLGFDAFHHRLQSTVVHPGADPRAAAAGCAADAPALLAPFGVAAPEARTTALLYLIELSVRYLEDRQAEAGALLGAPGEWLIPALTAQLADTRTHSARTGGHG